MRRIMLGFKSLTAKLIFISSIMLALFAIFITASYIFTHRLAGEARRVNLAGRERMLIRSIADNTMHFLEFSELPERDTFIENAKKGIAKYEEVLHGLRDGSKKLNLLPLPEHNKESISRLNALIELWQDIQEPILLDILRLPPERKNEACARCHSAIRKNLPGVEAFVTSLEKHYVKEIKDFDTFRYYGFGLFFISAVFIVFYVRRSIIFPVRRLRDATSEVEKGEFDTSIDITSSDEIGELSQSFNRMAQTLDMLYDAKARFLRNINVLHEASRDIVGEINNIESFLKRVVDNARELLGSRYAVLGILDKKGGYESFIPSGIEQQVYDELSKKYGLPSGMGLLNHFSEAGKPFRIDDISKHPASVGFPEGHPAMKTLLGVPITLYDKNIGRLFFADKLEGERFTQEDENLAMSYANTVALAMNKAYMLRDIKALASFPEKNPYPVIECDMECNIIYLNPAARKLIDELNIKGNELLPPNITEIAMGLESLNKELEYHEVKVGEMLFGEFIHLMPDKETVRIYTFDITEKKKAEESLRRRDERLIRQHGVLLELSKLEIIKKGELKVAFKEITERSSKILDVERISIWLYNDDHTKIYCLDLYEKSADRHSECNELSIRDYPAYFKALGEGRTIAAHDVQTDPRTREFSQSYLSPLNITSMLDATFRFAGDVVGVICYEHVGRDTRTWTVEEQDFAGSIADLLSLTLEASERKEAEESLLRSEKKFQDIFQFVPESLLAVNRQIEIQTSNKAFETLIQNYSLKLNMSPDELKEKILLKMRNHFGKTKHGIIEIRRKSSVD